MSPPRRWKVHYSFQGHAGKFQRPGPFAHAWMRWQFQRFDPTPKAAANTLFVDGNIACIGGWQANAAAIDVATVWIYDTTTPFEAGGFSSWQVTDGTQDAQVDSIVVSGFDFYAARYESTGDIYRGQGLAPECLGDPCEWTGHLRGPALASSPVLAHLCQAVERLRDGCFHNRRARKSSTRVPRSRTPTVTLPAISVEEGSEADRRNDPGDGTEPVLRVPGEPWGCRRRGCGGG